MNALTLLIVVVVTLLLLQLIYRKLYLPLTYWRREKIPHLTAWPIVGSFGPVFLQREHFYDFGIRVYRKFQHVKIFGVFQMGQPILIVRDPEVVHQITTKYFDHFVNHSMLFNTGDLDPLMSKNLVMLNDQEWHRMRGILSPTFTGSKMRGMFQFMAKCGEQLSSYLTNQYQSGQDVLEVELKSTFTKFTNDVIATTAFGIEVDSFKNPENVFYKNAQKATNFTWWRILLAQVVPWLMRLLKEGMLPRKVTDYFKHVIFNAVAQREEKGIVRPDMLHLLIEAKKTSLEKAAQGNPVPALTDLDIASQAFIFFFAGYEITATTMCFACYELAVNPDSQKKLHDEIDRALEKSGGKVSYEMLQEMKYLDAVMTETLRRWQGGGGLLDRVCNKDFLIKDALGPGKDYTVKKGMNVNVLASGIQMDPQFYPNPERFDPERFYDNNVDSALFMSFGAGPRHCIGIRFAQLEVKTALFNILKDFEVVPTKNTPIPIQLEKSASNLVPVGGFTVGLKQRSKQLAA